MFVLSNFLTSLAYIVNIVLTTYYWIIIVSVVVSWVNPDPFNQVVRFLRAVTDPLLRPIRRLLPVMPLDFSPFIAVLLIFFLKSFLIKTLYDLALRLESS